MNIYECLHGIFVNLYENIFFAFDCHCFCCFRKMIALSNFLKSEINVHEKLKSAQLNDNSGFIEASYILHYYILKNTNLDFIDFLLLASISLQPFRRIAYRFSNIYTLKKNIHQIKIRINLLFNTRLKVLYVICMKIMTQCLSMRHYQECWTIPCVVSEWVRL